MAAQTHLVYEFDDFQIAPDERRLSRSGQLIPLSGKAFEMLLALVRNRGRLLTKDELFQLVWPDQIVEESNLTVNMSAIRRALGERASSPRYIATISGRGYRFTADVRQFAGQGLTIERERFARMVVQQEEIESSVFTINLFDRLAAHRLLLATLVAFALIIAAGSFWIHGSFYRASVVPPPWSNVTPRRFATHGVPFRVAISPDGKSIAYRQRINGKDTLWLGQIESNSSVPISERTDLTYQALVFSPDSSNLYVTARGWKEPRSKLMRMPAIGGVMTDLIQNVDSPVTFSPDGKQLAFIRRDPQAKQASIIIADAADGKNEHVLATSAAPTHFSSTGLTWSPDGKLIAVGLQTNEREQSEIVGIRVADATVNRIGSNSWGVIGNMAWSPDGSGVLTITRDNPAARRAQVWFVPYPAGAARKLTNDLNVYLSDILSVSTDGKLLLLQGHLTSEIRIAPGGDIKRSRVVLKGVEPEYEGVDGLAWKPDGHLLYSAYSGDGQGIWEISNDGRNVHQLTANRLDSLDRQMRVTRDGRYIVFQSNRSGSFQIWRVNADGSDLRQLTTGGENTQPTLSPDGQWIVYASEGEGQAGLRKISIDGGEPVVLTDRKASAPEVSPDGRQIAYFYFSSSLPLRLHIIPATGGEPSQDFAVPDTVVWARRMLWMPDGRSVVYKDSIQGLWQQRLDQPKPQLVKGFEDLETYQLAWSFNGQDLAYSTGDRMQEIVLLQNTK